MKAQYIRAMDSLHRVCLIVASACLIIITLIIPYGVFTRYVLNSAASWPEPIATLLMIIMSFFKSPANAAPAGRRRAHFRSRPAQFTGRAATGSPAWNRRRSSARSRALA